MFKLPLGTPESREDCGEKTHSEAWGWSVVWLNGEIRAHGQAVRLGEAMGARSCTAVDQSSLCLPQRPELILGTARVDGSLRAKPSTEKTPGLAVPP